MKKMKYFMSMFLALVMCLSLVACGAKSTEAATKTGEEIGCYTQTNDAGKTILVDKDGKPVPDYTLDVEGNAVDTEGNVVVKAADLTAYVVPSTDADKGTASDADKPTADGDKATDEQKPDEPKKDSKDNKSDVKADEKDNTAKNDTKQDTKPSTKPENKPSNPSTGSNSGSSSTGSSTSGSGTTGSSTSGSGSSSGSSSSTSGSNTGSDPTGGSSGTGTGSTTPPTPPTTPTSPTKADIDCEAAMRAGNAYAESLGFEYWDGCTSYSFPVYFEQECTPHTQERLEQELRSMVDGTKAIIEDEGRWHPGEEGWGYPGIKCVVQWNASAGYHELYVYFAG